MWQLQSSYALTHHQKQLFVVFFFWFSNYTKSNFQIGFIFTRSSYKVLKNFIPSEIFLNFHYIPLKSLLDSQNTQNQIFWVEEFLTRSSYKVLKNYHAIRNIFTSIISYSFTLKIHNLDFLGRGFLHEEFLQNS